MRLSVAAFGLGARVASFAFGPGDAFGTVGTAAFFAGFVFGAFGLADLGVALVRFGVAGPDDLGAAASAAGGGAAGGNASAVGGEAMGAT